MSKNKVDENNDKSDLKNDLIKPNLVVVKEKPKVSRNLLAFDEKESKTFTNGEIKLFNKPNLNLEESEIILTFRKRTYQHQVVILVLRS